MSDHRVILGDCLDPVTGLASLPDKSVDHVITDPPYSERVHARRNRTEHLNGYAVPAIDFVALSDEHAAEVAQHIARVVRRWAFIFCADDQISIWRSALTVAGLRFVRTGAWVKADPMPQMTGDRPAQGFEFIALAHPAGRTRWNGGGKPLTYTGPRLEGKPEHPTQKPLWLLDRVIRDFTDPGDLILDPFAGSGTTGVACKRLGRRFIGWERDPRYHAIAERRIANAREQLGLWTGSA